MKSKLLLRLGIVFALALVPSFLLAQAETGRIVGTVADQSGGRLPGASVSLKSTGTGASRNAVTDTNGAFVFANLLPGKYEVKVELSGFSSALVPVTVTVGSAI